MNDLFADLYTPPERPAQPARPVQRSTGAAQAMAGPGEQQSMPAPRAPQAAAAAGDLFGDMGIQAQQAAPGQPAPYTDKRQALDDAVNYLDEGRDIAEVERSFAPLGVTRDEIIQHAQQRGAVSAQPQQTQPAAPRMGITANGTQTIQPTQDSAAEKTAGVIVRGYEQAKRAAVVAAREIRAINDAQAAKALGASMETTQGGRFAQPVDVQQTMTELGEAETFGEGFAVIAKNPLKFVEGIAESVIASLPQMAGTVAAGLVAGPAGMAAAAGAGSMATEYASAIAEAVTQAGGDPTDPAAIERAFQDPELMAAARAKGAQRGLVIGTFDALTAGVAGKFIQGAKAAQKEAAKAGVKAGAKGSMGIAAAKEATVQSGGAAAGEIGAQATQGEFKPGEVLGEVAADVPGSVSEVATGVREDVRNSRKPVAAAPGIAGATTAGTQGSVGAAGTDKELERRTRAANLPVPVPISKGAATKNPVQQQFEKQLIQDAESGADLRKLSTESTEAILQNFDALEEQTGRQIAGSGSDLEASTEAVGKSVVSPILELVDKKKAEVKAAYDEADAAGETAEPVSYAKLTDYLSQQTPTEKEKISPILKLAEEQIAKNDPDGTGFVSLKATRDIRQAINAAMEPGTPGYGKGVELKALIDESTRDAGGDLYQAARKLHQKYAAEFKNQGIIRDLIKFKRGTTDRQIAFEKVFRNTVMTGSVEDLRRLEKTLMGAGEQGAQAMRELRGEAVRYIRAEATRTQSKDDKGNKVPSVAGLSKAVESLDKDGKLEMLFGKQGAQVFRDMAEAASDIYGQPVGLVNTSGTAQALKKIGQGLADMAATTFLTGGAVPAPVLTSLKWLNEWRAEKKVKKQVAEAVKQPTNLGLDRKPDLTARPFERSAPAQATQPATSTAPSPRGPAKAAPVPAGKATELDDRTARKLLPTKRERELFRLLDEATDPEIRKDLQRQIDADRTQRERQARGEEYLKLADSATDPEVRQRLEKKAKDLGVERKIPAGDATEVQTVEATSLADVEAAWQKQEGLNAAEAQRAKDVLEAYLIDPEATTKATTQFASQPGAYDRAIRSIIEKGKGNAAPVETIVPGSDAAERQEGSVREEGSGDGDQSGQPKFSERPAPQTASSAKAARDKLIELRKRVAVLNALKRCQA